MSTELKRESRATRHPANIRTEQRDGKEVKIVEGYGIVFYNAADPGSEYRMYPDLIERVDPAACNRCLAAAPAVRCFVNHSPNNMLGRTDKGTMRIAVDAKGCRYSTDIPDTNIGRDTEENLRNGNLDGSSFSFGIVGQRWEDIKQADGSFLTIRTLTDLDIYEMGPVNMPAYESTTAGLRSGESPEEIRAQRDAWRDGLKRQAQAQAEAIAIRARAMEMEGTDILGTP